MVRWYLNSAACGWYEIQLKKNKKLRLYLNIYRRFMDEKRHADPKCDLCQVFTNETISSQVLKFFFNRRIKERSRTV
jgi:hypothetical protein